MKVIVQETFATPENLAHLAEEPLVIHQRTASSANRHIVVFVHGLGGSRHGKKSTWGSFPAYFFEDFPNVDVGLYGYRSAMGRWRISRSVPVPTEAEILASNIRMLRQERRYDWIILIGHSMGGLLCKGAVAWLLENGHRASVERVTGLMLMATPQLGSLRVPGFLRSLTNDAKALRAHSDFVAKTMNAFQSRFHCSLWPGPEDRVHLPTWAVLGASDFWVDALSAGVGIADDQSLKIRGSHASVVKPAHKDADSYVFARRFLTHALQPRALPFKTDNCRPLRKDELRDIREFSVGLFGDGVTPLEAMEAWWDRDPQVYQIVERVIKAAGQKTTTTVGYFCVYPISHDAAAALRRGELSGAQLTPQHLPAGREALGAAYVGAVAGVDRTSKAAALAFLQAHLQHLAGRKPLTILTRPITDDGLHLVNGHAFRPVGPAASEALGTLHESSVTGLGRRLRGAPKRRQQRARNAAT